MSKLRERLKNFKLVRKLVYVVVGLVSYPGLNIINKLHISGTEHLKGLPKQKVLFVSNHQTYFADVITFLHIFCAVKWGKQNRLGIPYYFLNPFTRVNYVAAEQTMNGSWISKLFTLAGALTVRRTWNAEAGEKRKGLDPSDTRKITRALDAIILDILFRQPLWSLARGDAFKSPSIRKLFQKLKILPVYRTSEGVENLSENYTTFNNCIDLFSNNGQVIIFSEGKCVNEWHLRPLKKGTARLAMQAWTSGIALQVLPVGINYSSFRRFGKNIFINFGDMIHASDFDLTLPDGARNQSFNNLLASQLGQLVYEIPKDDKQLQKEKLAVSHPTTLVAMLAIPALAGLILNIPFYAIVKLIVRNVKTSDHYDSIVTGLVLFFYPFYLLLFTVVSVVIFGNAGFVALAALPLLGRAAMQLKPQLDK